jgi:hypothetical protein
MTRRTFRFSVNGPGNTFSVLGDDNTIFLETTSHEREPMVKASPRLVTNDELTIIERLSDAQSLSVNGPPKARTRIIIRRPLG